MEFVKQGEIPSSVFFELRHVMNTWTGESYEDFGFKRDSVVMTQEEYDELVEKATGKEAKQ